MIAPLLVLLAAAAAEPLTEERAVEIALRESPALRALADEHEEARALVAVASKLKNPELRVENLRSDRLVSPALTEDEYQERPLEDVGLGLRWSPPNLGARRAERAQAERLADQAAAELDEARRGLAARVRSLHATIRSQDAQIELLRAASQRRGEMRALVGRRLEQQAATVLEQSLADLDWLDALADLQELESERRQRFHELLVELGASPAEKPALAAGAAVECVAPPADPAPLVRRAVANSPKLRAHQARLAEVEAERSELKLALVPWLDHLQLDYEFPGRNQTGFLALRFAVPLPLLDWNRADLRALAFKRSRIQAEEKADAQELESRVVHALQELAEQAALVARYRDAAPLIEDSLARLRRALEVAEADLLQMALVQTRVLSARRAHLRAALDCRLHQIELDRLVGP